VLGIMGHKQLGTCLKKLSHVVNTFIAAGTETPALGGQESIRKRIK